MKLPKRYTEDGDEITTVVTCQTCDYVTYNEVPDICPRCLMPTEYNPPVEG